MEYVEQLRNKKTGRRLSASGYGNKRSALRDLFRWHGVAGGFTRAFEQELSDLYKGFRRILAQGTANDPGNDGDGQDVKEGKDPMSVELYRKLCLWFLELGTDEGIWGYCFFVLTWNLMCRANSTTRVQWNHMFWMSADSLEIHFRHHKGDQLGTKKAYPRHIFANPLDCLVCPIFALSLYLTTFNTLPAADGRIFPGRNQFKRFSDLMKKVLDAHADEVCSCGHSPKDIGTHSIRKGSSTYLSSLPGGPPAAVICIRAGWSLGKVQEIYIKYEQGGDQFAGRCLAMLPLLKPQFAVSPPHFSTDVSRQWINETKASVFAMVSVLPSQSRLLEMCLAQMVYHRSIVLQWAGGHVIRMNCQLFRDPTMMEQATVDGTQVLHPWSSDDYVFSGVPPHVVLLHEVHTIAEQQKTLVEQFLTGVTGILDSREIGGGAMSTQRLRELLDEATKDIREQLNSLTENGPGSIRNSTTCNQGTTQRQQFVPHLYGGTFHWLPQDWRFPSVGVLMLWQTWLLGDTVQNVPPLRMLSANDVAHLDALPLEQGTRRRPARKTLSDIRYLMNYVESKVQEAGQWTEEHNPTTVTEMYRAVEEHFVIRGDGRNHQRRDSQIKWSTMVLLLRKRARQQAANMND
jgi:hypothetical protein